SGYQPRPEKIAYTGTHDNQTIVGYCESRYPDLDAEETADDLIEKVVMCDAPVRVLPLQDVLGLDDEARMNTPGTVEGNWAWQADSAAIEQAGSRMKALAELCAESR
ncbi:MAG: 4-alpha-glucanotransferase, partial [Eggerthellaceae bacterium]|nr:4-alpha-glucanotransferase [Eggerthellaceae bacterium]